MISISISEILIPILAFLRVPPYRDYIKSDYGRKYGWWVEFEGEIIGEFTDVKWEDMFWDSYEIRAISQEKEEILFDMKYWNYDRFQFRNKKFYRCAKNAFPSGDFSDGIAKGKRIFMRSLYLHKP